MNETHFSYESSPTLWAFRESDALIKLVIGPWGSGKSSACVDQVVKRALEQRPGADGIRRSRAAVIRNTEQQLKDTTIKTFLEWLPEAQYGRFYADSLTYVITGFEGVHLEVMFRALDNLKQLRNLLSLELSFAWINEAREILAAIMKGVTGRVGRYPSRRDAGVGATWPGVFMDTNPPDERHWIYHMFEETGAGEDYINTGNPDLDRLITGRLRELDILEAARPVVFHQPSGLSPEAENTQYLEPGYYPRLCVGKDEDWILVNVEAQYGFVKAGRPVFPQYRDHIHCRETKPIPGRLIYRGWDFGLTPACAFIQLSPAGQFRVLDELTAVDSGIDTFTDKVLRHCREHYRDHTFRDIGDPAGQQKAQTDKTTCFDIMRAKGIDIEPGRQTLQLRLESIKYPLNRMTDGEPGFVVDPKAKLIRQGMRGGYCYRQIATVDNAFRDVPDKNEFSHPIDAMEYVGTEVYGEILKHGPEDSAPRQIRSDQGHLERPDRLQGRAADYTPLDGISGFDPLTHPLA